MSVFEKKVVLIGKVFVIQQHHALCNAVSFDFCICLVSPNVTYCNHPR